MKLRAFRFLADENIDREVVVWLRKQGYSVLDVKEEGLFSRSDQDLMALAYEEARIIISQDSDFGTLIFRDKAEFMGIIFLRPGHRTPDFHVPTLQALFSIDRDFQPPFIIVAENRISSFHIRIREL